jgi:DNA-binding MarR family transcriptional regulator
MSQSREDLIDTIFSSMQRMHRVGSAKFHTLIGRHDISPSQLELLLTVKHRSSINVKELAATMQLTPGAVTQIVEGLVQNGYVERREDERDRRITNIVLADGGKQKLKELWEQRLNVMKKIMQSLTTEELAVFSKVQEKMSAHMEAEMESLEQTKKETK